jgi:GT2 family glycosyltransferase
VIAAMISVCVAAYRTHAAPNLSTLALELPDALAGEAGELVVALNGIGASCAGVPAWARTVDLGANLGVAPGWNAAAKAAQGDVLVFCNDDVELGEGALAMLSQALRQDAAAGVVGPAGSRWDLRGGAHLGPVLSEGHHELPAGAPGASLVDAEDQEMVECDVVSGFLFACRRCDWEAVGGFDEHYAPASWEEVDFCTAVRARGGHCYVVAGVNCKHEWGVSKRQLPWARARWAGRSETWRSIHRRNRRHFMQKWSEHPVADLSPVPAGRR